MKVLQVFGELQRGGAETMLMNLYREIDKEKYQFDFLVKKRVSEGYEQEILSLGGNIIEVPSARIIGTISYIKRVYNIIKQNHYDAIHSHINESSSLPLLSAMLAGVPVRISHSHNTQFGTSELRLIIMKLLIGIAATSCVACSDDAGKALFGHRDYYVIHNGINITKFKLASSAEHHQLKKQLYGPDNCLQICHIGRFVITKNQSFIVDVAEAILAKYPELTFKITLIGDGELKSEVENKIAARGLCHFFNIVGVVSTPEQYLKGCDVFILPSIFEGLPLTLLEAQCSGARCIVSSQIAKDADAEVGLVEYAPLRIKQWADKIVRNGNGTSHSRYLNSLKASESLKMKGFSPSANIKILEELYCGKMQ